MVEPPPPSPFEVVEPDLAFQFLIIPFDTPPHHHDMDQLPLGVSIGKRRQPEFRRFVGAFRPFNEQPFLLRHSSAFGHVVGTDNANRPEARCKNRSRRFPLSDFLEHRLTGILRESKYRDRGCFTFCPRCDCIPDNHTVVDDFTPTA